MLNILALFVVLKLAEDGVADLHLMSVCQRVSRGIFFDYKNIIITSIKNQNIWQPERLMYL